MCIVLTMIQISEVKFKKQLLNVHWNCKQKSKGKLNASRLKKMK